MRRLLCGMAALFALSGFAAADDLDEAYQACSQHTGVLASKRAFLTPGEHTPKWEVGWEHCEKIDQIGKTRQAETQRAKAQADQAKTKALADQLGK